MIIPRYGCIIHLLTVAHVESMVVNSMLNPKNQEKDTRHYFLHCKIGLTDKYRQMMGNNPEWDFGGFLDQNREFFTCILCGICRQKSRDGTSTGLKFFGVSFQWRFQLSDGNSSGDFSGVNWCKSTNNLKDVPKADPIWNPIQKKLSRKKTVLNPIQFVHLLTVILGQAHLTGSRWPDGRHANLGCICVHKR